MILGSQGNAGGGKSALAYSGPLPLVGFAFDAGAMRAIYGSRYALFKGIDIKIVSHSTAEIHMMDLKKAAEFWTRNGGYAITIYNFTVPLQVGVRVTGSAELWNLFMGLYNEAVRLADVPTVAVDTMTIARRVATSAHLQDLQARDPGRVSMLQIEYGRPNDKVRAALINMQNQAEVTMYEAMERSGVRQKNLNITHHLTGVFHKKQDRNGNEISVEVLGADGKQLMELEGLNNTLRFVDVMLEMTPKLLPTGLPHPMDRQMGVEAKFIKCGFDLSLTGSTINNPTWDSLASLLNQRLSGPFRIQKRGDVPEEFYIKEAVDDAVTT